MYEIGQLVVGNTVSSVPGIDEFSTCEVLDLNGETGMILVEIVMAEYESSYVGDIHWVDDSTLGAVVDRANAISSAGVQTNMNEAILLGLV